MTREYEQIAIIDQISTFEVTSFTDQIETRSLAEFSIEAQTERLDPQGETLYVARKGTPIDQNIFAQNENAWLNSNEEEKLNKFRTSQAELIRKLITDPDEQALLLEGTGFDNIKQVVSLLEELHKIDRNTQTFEEVKHHFATKTQEDLKGYFWEFVRREPVLKIELATTDNGLKKDVIAPKYGNKPLIDTVSANDRDGSTKEGIINLINILTNEQSGIYAVASPNGWSGIVDENGNELVFPESQFYIYRKVGNVIDGYTVRNSLSLTELRTFAKNNGAELKNPLSEAEQIKELVSTPINLSESANVEDVVMLLSKATESAYLWLDKSTGQSWSLSEMTKGITLSRDIWEVNRNVQAIIDSIPELVESLKDLSNSEISRLTLELGKKALQIRRASRNLDPLEKTAVLPMSLSEYKQEALSAKQDLGCQLIIGGSIATPFGLQSLESTIGKKILCCTCPFCNQKVEAEIYGGEIHCTNPNCKKTAPWKG